MLGLHKLSNITSTFPTGTHLYQAIPRRDRAVTRYTYAQAYTKALDSSAFHNRPFLLTLLLGKDYMRDHTEFTNTYNSTTKLLKYQQIREAIVLKMTRSKARLKFVISTPRIEALFSEPNNNQPSSVLADQGKNLFIFLLPFHYSLQVPCDNMWKHTHKRFSMSSFNLWRQRSTRHWQDPTPLQQPSRQRFCLHPCHQCRFTMLPTM